MESIADSASAFNKVINQDLIKLDRFDGSNFNRWKDKITFLLTELAVFYVLDPELTTISAPQEDDSEEIKAGRKKREDDEVRCRGHILNSLSDRLYDLYRSFKSPKEIWDALEVKYNSEKQGTDKFMCMKYIEFTMVDNKLVMNQVDELQVLVSKLKDLKVEVSETLQVAVIIAKLPQSWNDFRKKLLHTSETITIDQLLTHIRIEEETRIREKKMFSESGISKVNHIEKGTRFQKNSGGNKRKYPDSNNTNKTSKACFHCGKKGHFKRDCRLLKKQKIEKSAKANLVEQDDTELIAMISDAHISMITEVNMATGTKSTDWWYDSGATVHVCNNKSLFKEFENADEGQQVLMGNNNTVKVHGKCTVKIQFTSRKKIIIVNVFYVPEIRKNLVSANLLWKKGFKDVIEAKN